MRKLTPFFSAASSAKPAQSCLAISSRLQLRSQSHSSSPFTYTPPAQCQIRTYSQSPTLAASPFRLSSTTPSADHDTDTDFESQSQSQSQPRNPNSDEYYSPYKPKRQWPPDMSKLSPKHQFRLERKYRRRAALKYARPKWVKMTKLAQWASIGFVIIYALLFMEWDERGSPFDEIRRVVFSSIKGVFSAPPPASSMRRSDDSSRE
ncbi:hypothetical protein AOCH_002737 [Aspergillus ochraceoroseus]|uniref:Uncharacterized protein n=1 Tax=Aspergillus ochraceoroseus TaxID=138278 RepID=A0A0F8WSG1_9EURO|nr:hypothetical protein AOCH_002737 [Aspergillus ochraceoroseus]